MLHKFLSGRWLFTLAAAVVFVLLSLAGKLPSEAVIAIIMYVVQSYFNRSDRQTQGVSDEKV
jgi:hypothetical protein